MQVLATSLGRIASRLDHLSLPGGEATKSLSTYASLMEDLLGLGVDRRVVLVAVGGGVIGDLVGFAAASLLRGVDFIQVPTTLLAQVDSSVGGKTGINARVGKNLIGAFLSAARRAGRYSDTENPAAARMPCRICRSRQIRAAGRC